jgi:hypothetical protein
MKPHLHRYRKDISFMLELKVTKLNIILESDLKHCLGWIELAWNFGYNSSLSSESSCFMTAWLSMPRVAHLGRSCN